MDDFMMKMRLPSCPSLTSSAPSDWRNLHLDCMNPDAFLWYRRPAAFVAQTGFVSGRVLPWRFRQKYALNYDADFNGDQFEDLQFYRRTQGMDNAEQELIRVRRNTRGACKTHVEFQGRVHVWYADNVQRNHGRHRITYSMSASSIKQNFITMLEIMVNNAGDDMYFMEESIRGRILWKNPFGEG